MAVRLRLMRGGRRNRAFYRIVAADSRSQRDGRTIERLGYYDPLVADEQKKVTLTKDRVEYWLGVGAQPTNTVRSILKSRGVKFPKDQTAAKRREQRKKKAQAKKAKPKGSLRKAKKTGSAKKAAPKKAAPRKAKKK